jgi:hypothetical protein
MSSDLTTRAESLDATPFRGRTPSAGGHGAPDLLGSRLNGSVTEEWQLTDKRRRGPVPPYLHVLTEHPARVRPVVTSWQADPDRV